MTYRIDNADMREMLPRCAPDLYVPKARGERLHPTEKPLDLMRYLVRLATRPGGCVLDPFAGSGTTIAASVAEGMSAYGIELDKEQP